MSFLAERALLTFLETAPNRNLRCAALCLSEVRHTGGQSRGGDEAAKRLTARPDTAARREDPVQVPQGQGGAAEHHLRGVRAAGAALG